METIVPDIAGDAATRGELFAYLARLGIATETVEHEAVFTVAESERLERDLPGGHTKNLFLKDAKGRLFLVVAESHTAVDLKTLHKKLGAARFSFGKAELLAETLGVQPGSVTALALINDHAGRLGSDQTAATRPVVSTVVDQRLMGYDRINCHPLVNTATTSIGRDDLIRFMRATGHEPQIVDLGGDDGVA